MIDRQEIFNTAVAGLHSQGFERSVNSTGQCLYRTDDGKRCAVGWCIPDDKYSVDFECKNVCAAMISKDVFDLTITDNFEEIWFLECLQKCHDSGITPNRMVRKLSEFAKVNGLEQPTSLRKPKKETTQ